MPRRGPGYATLGRLETERNIVSWYWRGTAFVAAWLILGGFLTLPAQFDTNAQLRVSTTSLAVFSVALVTAGFALTGLVCYAVPNWIFQADAVFLPSFSSSAIGFLTVVYCFVVSSRYTWNTSALLTVVVAALSLLVYGCLLFWTQRRIALLRTTSAPAHIPLAQAAFPLGQTAYQSPNGPDPEGAYYTNYVANMFPSAVRSPHSDIQPSPQFPINHTEPESCIPAPPTAALLTEDELTRQQMLMLLLNKPEPVSPPNPAPPTTGNNSTYRVDWTGNDQEPPSAHPRNRAQSPSFATESATQQPRSISPPYNGYYAPTTAQHPAHRTVPTVSVTPPSASDYGSASVDGAGAYFDATRHEHALQRRVQQHQRVPSGNRYSSMSAAEREARRIEIERGG